MQTPEDVLFEVEQTLVKQGHPKLDAETLKEAYKHLTNPQVLQQIQAGQLTPQHIAEQVGQALQVVQARRKTPQQGLVGKSPASSGQLPPYVEGGLINDQSGQATARARQLLRRPAPPIHPDEFTLGAR